RDLGTQLIESLRREDPRPATLAPPLATGAADPGQTPVPAGERGMSLSTPGEKARVEGNNPSAPNRTNLWARLSGNRYQSVLGGKEETVRVLAGLRVVEYLLKQPGKAAHVMEINRALSEGNPRAAGIEDAFARSGEQQGLDGFTADAWRSLDPCGEENLEKA